MNRRRTWLVIGALAVLATAGAARDRAAAQPGARAVDGNLTLAEAKRFRPFALYYVGMQFDGLPLLSVNRRLDPLRNRTAIGGRRNYVTFWYGDCDPPCGAPLELQVWSACDRNYSFYTRGIDQDGRIVRVRPLAHENVRVRGVPATWWKSAGMLELYTGRVTVVVFAGRDRAFRAAQALRGLNLSVPAGADLPPPAPGHVTGRLKC